MVRGTPWGAGPRPRSLRERVKEVIAPAALGAHLILAPQLLGGVFPWGMIAIATSALLCLGLALWRARKVGAGDNLTLVGWSVLAAWLFTVVQAMPLPCGLVEWIQPESVEHLQRTLRALNEPAPTLCTLSFDPGNTREEIVKGIGIVGTFFATWLLCGCGARGAVVWSVALSGLLMALVALVHGALGLESVFGLYEPEFAKREILLAPIMNQNSLGGFIAMTVPLWMSLSSRERRFEIRVFTYAAVVVCVIAVFLTLSRGAIVVLCASTLAMGAVIVRRKRKRSPGKFAWLIHERSAVIVSALLVGIGIGVFGGYGGDARVLKEFEVGNTSKLDVVRKGFALSFEHPWIGVGRGAFSSMFIEHLGDTGRFEYPENVVAQWTSEWGIPLGLLVLGSFALAIATRLRRSLSTRRVGVVVGVLVITLHCMLDIALELVGVATVATALLSCVIAPTRRPRGSRRSGRRGPRIQTWLAGTVLIGLSAAALASLSPALSGDSFEALDDRLRALVKSRDRAAFRETLVHGLRLHPNEPQLFVLATGEALLHNDLEPIGRYVNLAILLAPGWVTPRAQAATWLYKRGVWMQALDQLHAAASIDHAAVHKLICAMVKEDPRGVYAAAPATDQRFRFLEVASDCLPWETDASRAFDTAVRQEYPTAYWPHRREVMRLEKSGQRDAAVKYIDAVLASGPQNAPLLTLRAELLLRAGRARDAIQASADAEKHAPVAQRGPLLTVRLHAAAELGDSATVTATLAEVRGLAGLNGEALARTYTQEGRVRTKMREFGAALHAFEEAYRISPDTNRLRDIAVAAEGLGHRRRALSAFMRLCSDNPRDAEACAKRAALGGYVPGP